MMRYLTKGYNNRTEEFMVVTEFINGANRYRAVSITGGYLSEAVGYTVEELVNEVCGIEEVSDPIMIPQEWGAVE